MKIGAGKQKTPASFLAGVLEWERPARVGNLADAPSSHARGYVFFKLSIAWCCMVVPFFVWG